MLVIAALFAMARPIPAWTQGTAAIPIADTPPEPSAAVWSIVRGIVSYTRWPSEPDPVRLCVVGPSRFGGDWAERTRGAPGRGIDILSFPAPEPALPDRCDALYVGELPDADRQQLLGVIAGRPMLTIFESDPSCRGGAMFCLRADNGRPTFRMNLDAVARSGTRVHPRVLQLARPPEGQP